jgi:probable F420-dependent oxidoreductase
MLIGAIFPGAELGDDVTAIRDWVQAADDLGYQHILVFEHLIGFRDAPNPSAVGPVTPAVLLHEPLTFLAFLAGITRHVELVTGVLVLPMRQTVLVAKQAAEIDALSGGRLRLGVGVGHVERGFRAMNENWRNRGKRIEEQITLLRALWTDDALTFDGEFHQVGDRGGLTRPWPVQRPVPIWLGGNAEPAIDRAARLGDGWMPTLLQPDDHAKEMIARFRSFVARSGRAENAVGLNVFAALRSGAPEQWHEHATAWRELGATYLTAVVERAGFDSPQAHIDALRRWSDSV